MGDYYESNDLLMMLQALGAQLIDATQDPPKAKFDDATMQQAMQWYVDLHTQHDVKPVFVTDFSELLSQAATALAGRETMINSGRAAMWTAYAGQPDLLGDGKREQLNRGVVPLPIGPAGSKAGSYITSSGYFISADGAAKQACWKWINFLTEQAEVRQGLPARQAVAESEAYKQQVGAERAAAYRASLGSGGVSSVYQFLNGQDSWLSNSILWLTDAYGQAVEGKVSVEKALADAQQMADDYRACVVQNNGQSDTQQQRKCVKQVDPSIPDFLLGLNE